MDNLLLNIASGLWIVLGVLFFFGLRSGANGLANCMKK